MAWLRLGQIFWEIVEADVRQREMHNPPQIALQTVLRSLNLTPRTVRSFNGNTKSNDV